MDKIKKMVRFWDLIAVGNKEDYPPELVQVHCLLAIVRHRFIRN